MQKKLSLFIITSLFIVAAFAQNSSSPTLVVEAAYFDVSPPLRDMPAVLTGPKDQSWKNGVIENKSMEEEIEQRIKNAPANQLDGAAQKVYLNNGSRGPLIAALP